MVAPGIQLDFGKVPGLTEALGQRGVSSNYRADLPPRAWEFIRDLRGGTARPVSTSRRASTARCRGPPSGTGTHLLDALGSHGIFRKYELVLDVAGDAPDPAAARRSARVGAPPAERPLARRAFPQSAPRRPLLPARAVGDEPV